MPSYCTHPCLKSSRVETDSKGAVFEQSTRSHPDGGAWPEGEGDSESDGHLAACGLASDTLMFPKAVLPQVPLYLC